MRLGPLLASRRAWVNGFATLVLLGFAAFYLYYRPLQPAAVSISPADVTLIPSDRARFTITVVDSLGNQLTTNALWSSTGGQVDDGVLVAPTTVGMYTVTASVGALSASASVLVVPGPPASASVSPPTKELHVSASHDFGPSFRDAWGNQVTNPVVSWSVSPTHLGTVTPTGSFVAKASGTGTVTAYSGTASSTTDLTVLCPFTPTAATSGFTVICTASTELHVESGAATATGPLVQVADADVRELEARFGRPFQRRPVVHAFGSTETFTSGLQRVFRMTVNEARRTAEESQALFASNPGYTIGINWQEAGEDSPVTVLRHELTHMMIRQVVGPRTGAVVPTWLNEGMAHTEEFAVAGAEAEAAVHRSGSASMAANNALLTFQQLDGDAWDEATGERAHYQRYAASQAVRFLREDLGDATVVRLFDVMAGGRTFTSAYATVAGKPFSEFAAAYPARVRALSSSYPTVTAVSGVGRLTFVAFGFGPNTAISVSVDGGETKEAKADGYGMYVTFLDSSWPAGSYTITVNAGGEAFTATGAK